MLASWSCPTCADNIQRERGLSTARHADPSEGDELLDDVGEAVDGRDVQWLHATERALNRSSGVK